MSSLQVRIARPVSDLARAREMYCRALGLHVLASFQDHSGFDGVILGALRALAGAIRLACTHMIAAGFREVRSFNPYWERFGRTFEDPDGYRAILQNARWHGP